MVNRRKSRLDTIDKLLYRLQFEDGLPYSNNDLYKVLSERNDSSNYGDTCFQSAEHLTGNIINPITLVFPHFECFSPPMESNDCVLNACSRWTREDITPGLFNHSDAIADSGKNIFNTFKGNCPARIGGIKFMIEVFSSLGSILKRNCVFIGKLAEQANLSSRVTFCQLEDVLGIDDIVPCFLQILGELFIVPAITKFAGHHSVGKLGSRSKLFCDLFTRLKGLCITTYDGTNH